MIFSRIDPIVAAANFLKHFCPKLWRTLLTIFIPSTVHGCLVVKNLFFRRRGRKYLWVAAGIGTQLAVPSCLMGRLSRNQGIRVTALSGPLSTFARLWKPCMYATLSSSSVCLLEILELRGSCGVHTCHVKDPRRPTLPKSPSRTADLLVVVVD